MRSADRITATITVDIDGQQIVADKVIVDASKPTAWMSLYAGCIDVARLARDRAFFRLESQQDGVDTATPDEIEESLL